jgi:hypothetical protein
VTACYFVRNTCLDFAGVPTRSDVDYFVDPVPTLVLSPKKGLAAASFKATYTTGEKPMHVARSPSSPGTARRRVG